MKVRAGRVSKCKSLKVSKPSEILPGLLYLGSVMEADVKSNLQEVGITNILCTMEEVWMPYPQDFEYKFLLINDEENEEILCFFDEISDYIHRTLTSKQGAKLLVHCFAGHSRSASFVIAYLMKYYEMTYDVALEFVKKNRETVSPNDGFVTQLRLFGQKLAARRIVAMEKTLPSTKELSIMKSMKERVNN